MPGRTIAIGDVHGCAQALTTLLDAIGPQTQDTIVGLGDYIDRGPESRQVVERLLGLKNQCQLVTLLGNHEAMLLLAAESGDPQELVFWRANGGKEALESYGGTLESIPAEHMEFFSSLGLSYETDDHAFIHANYDFQRPWNDQPEYLALWRHLSRIPPPPHVSGKTVIVGHTPQASGQILDLGHVVCIDTFCVGGGWLTALDVHSRTVWQTHRDGRLRESQAR